MIEVINNKFRVHQFGNWVEIGVRYRENGSWHGTELWKSYYGYVLGFTVPFEDEESANYAFVETCNYLRGLTP